MTLFCEEFFLFKDPSSWYGHGGGRIGTKFGSFLKNVSMFDHLEFGVTSKDARAMSLSTRKLLELSFDALLDSGIDYRGRNVGCYMSGVAFDILTIADPVCLNAFPLINAQLRVKTGRIRSSRIFLWRGLSDSEPRIIPFRSSRALGSHRYGLQFKPDRYAPSNTGR